MKIWVDADSYPIVVKEILYRAARRTSVQLTLLETGHSELSYLQILLQYRLIQALILLMTKSLKILSLAI